MKASELMLGYWVLDTRTKKTLRVNPFMAEMEVPEWEPIPITKELLEKNGFALDDVMYTNDVMTLHDDKKFIRTKNAWSVGAFKNGCHRIAHCELTYLHELQHLLRICKIDFDWEVYD